MSVEHTTQPCRCALWTGLIPSQIRHLAPDEPVNSRGGPGRLCPAGLGASRADQQRQGGHRRRPTDSYRREAGLEATGRAGGSHGGHFNIEPPGPDGNCATAVLDLYAVYKLLRDGHSRP